MGFTWAAPQLQLVQPNQVLPDSCITVYDEVVTNSCKTVSEVVCDQSCQEVVIRSCPPPELSVPLPQVTGSLPAIPLNCQETKTTQCSEVIDGQACKVVEKMDCTPITQLVPKVLCGKNVEVATTPDLASTTQSTSTTTEILITMTTPLSSSTTTQPFRIEDQPELVPPYASNFKLDPNNLQLDTFWSHFKGLIRNSYNIGSDDLTKRGKDHEYEPMSIQKFIFNTTTTTPEPSISSNS